MSRAKTAPRRKPRAKSPESGSSRTRLLVASLAVLLVVAAVVWWEPAELWFVSRGPLHGLERYVAHHPDSRPAAIRLSEAYLDAGRPDAAVNTLEPLHGRFPEDAALRTALGRALMEAGRDADAYAHLQVVVMSLRPGDPEARWWLGQLLERAGKTNEAYDQYEALVRTEPRRAAALIRLGFIAMGDGRTTKAEEFFRRAAEADPRNAEAHARLAETIFRLGRAEEAEKPARRAVALEPLEPRANFWLGRSLMTQDARRWSAEAEGAFRKVIQSETEEYTARYYLAKLYRELGRTEDAVRELQTSTRENPLHKDGFYDLALCQRALGKTSEADAAMAKFRKLNAIDQEGTVLEYKVWSQPGNVPAMVALVKHYLKFKRPDLARPFVERILRQDPRHAEARRFAAQIAANPEPSL